MIFDVLGGKNARNADDDDIQPFLLLEHGTEGEKEEPSLPLHSCCSCSS